MNSVTPYTIIKSNLTSDDDASIISDFNTAKANKTLSQSHFFGGRFENQTMKRGESVQFSDLLTEACQLAQALLGIDQTPKIGHWFNEMLPQQQTTLHTHDEDDEILSAVYYLSMPENSGNLILKSNGSILEIAPQVGHFIFFSPTLPHKVEVNQSTKTRLSIGMNFGLRSG